MNIAKINRLSGEYEELKSFLAACNISGMCLRLENPRNTHTPRQLTSITTGEILGGLRGTIRARLSDIERQIEKEVTHGD